MHDYPVESVLLARHHVPLRFDPAVIRSILDKLTPEGGVVLWASHGHASDGMDVEPWCGNRPSLRSVTQLALYLLHLTYLLASVAYWMMRLYLEHA
jgi:hypothetical protein